MGESLLLIDTNIVIEMLLAQERAKECAFFFNALRDRARRPCIITSFSL